MLKQMFAGLIVGLALTAAASPSVAASPERTSVMVLYFDNNTGNKDYDSLAKGLADMMITDLAAVPSLQIVEREKLEALLTELKLQRTKYFEPKTAQRLGKGVGAAYAVTGAFMSIEPNVRLDVRMVKIDTGVVVGSANVTGDKGKFFELQQRLTQKLVDGLGDLVSKSDGRKATAATATNRIDDLGAALDYAKGLDASDRGDLTAASQHLRKVVASSPGFKLGKERYQQILNQLYEVKDRRKDLLSQAEQTLVDHINRELSGAGRGRPFTNRQLAYAVLRSQYHLMRFGRAYDQRAEDSARYKDHVKALVDSQLDLFESTKTLTEYPTFNEVGKYSSGDANLAEELGIRKPGSTLIGPDSPSQVLRTLGELLAKNRTARLGADTRFEGASHLPCFVGLDPSYRQTLPDLYKQALARVETLKPGADKEEQSLRTLRDYAHALMVLGRSEEAMAKLQEGLERYPKAVLFKDVESDLRAILAGKARKYCVTPAD